MIVILVGSVNLQFTQEGHALESASFAVTATVMILTQMALQEIETSEGNLGFAASFGISVPALIKGTNVVNERLNFSSDLVTNIDETVERKIFFGVDVVTFCEKLEVLLFVDE